MQGHQLTNFNPKQGRAKLSWALSLCLGLTGLLLMPHAAKAEPEDLKWARVDFLSNRVQLVPREQRSRRAQIADVLSIGDALRTARASRAELRFNDGSLARIGERATFRFTPNTRNFQLSNGTVLLLIPPGRGRSTIQTPNAVTGIQGSALFVRYIPETNTTIVGALTDNPDGPMILFNEAGTERQALRSNEIGVIEGDQITQIYQFDGALFWQSSGLAEGFDYLSPPSQTGDPLDGVRQEIRDALSNQRPLEGDGVIENPDSFSRPAPPVEEVPEPAVSEPVAAESQEPDAATATAATADSPAPSSTIDSIPETVAPVETVSSDVPTNEVPDATEELDLEVALDLELDLELEADGVEAPDLDINETVQQYLGGGTTDLVGSSDFEAENSLQSIPTAGIEEDESESSSPAASGNGPAGEAKPASDSETAAGTPDLAPLVEDSSTVTNSPAVVENGSNSDSSVPIGGLNSELDGSDGSLNSGTGGDPSSGLEAEPDSSLADDLNVSNGPEPVVNSTTDSTIGGSLPSGPVEAVPVEVAPVEAVLEEPTVSTSSAVMAVPTAPEPQTVVPLVLPPQTVAPVPVLAPEIPETISPEIDVEIPETISPEIGVPAIEVPTEQVGEAVVPSSVNIIDLSPALDEPPVEVFLPTEKVDELMLIRDMDQEELMDDEMPSTQPPSL